MLIFEAKREAQQKPDAKRFLAKELSKNFTEVEIYCLSRALKSSFGHGESWLPGVIEQNFSDLLVDCIR